MEAEKQPMTARDDILAELEALRRAGNSPRATLWDQRRILKQRRELFAQLEALETQPTKGTTNHDDD